MDGTRFDTLIKRLAITPLTRTTALRGLVASVAALAGVTLAAEPGAAKNKRKVCHCTDETAASCKTLQVGRKAAKRHIKKHDCDYRRECKGVSGCCFADAQACTTSAQCCAGLFCGDGTCRPTGSCTVQGASCTGGAAACCTGECLDGLCRPTGSCLPLGNNTCAVNEDCCSGNCQVTTCFVCKSNLTTCDANLECCSGFCDIGGSNQCETPV